MKAIFWGNLGITYGEMGQLEEQLRLLRKSITLTPDNPQRLETLGTALNELGRTEQEAAKRQRRAAERRDHARAQALDAQARSRLEEAVRIFQEAEARLTPEQLARYPHLAKSIPYNLGAVLGDMGRYAESDGRDSTRIGGRSERCSVLSQSGADLLALVARGGDSYNYTG